MIFKFNNIELDTKNYRLLVKGVEQAIEPQVFNLIVYLIQNKAQVLSRDELLDNVWKGKNVSDSTISNHIKSARKALGDDGRKQEVIKTIHSRGYQFVAECKTADKPFSIATLSDNAHPKSKIPLLVFLIFVITLMSVWFLKQKTKPLELPDKRNHTIAVLAFKDLSPESNQTYFAEGMSEELLNLFAHIDGLSVASRTSSFSFKNKDMTLEKIGKELNVNYIIEGSVRKSGDKLRVTVQLIQVADGSHMWSKNYDYQIQDIFKIQDEIAQAVSEQLEVSLSKVRKKEKTVNPHAHSIYLKALYYFRENTDISINQALGLIDESIDLYEYSAPAWTLKSRIQYKIAVYSYDKDNRRNLDLAKKSIMRAKSLDNEYATAQAQMALLDLSLFDFQSAQFNMELAINFNDDSPETTEIMAQYFQLTGNIEKSVKLLEELADINPINDTHYLNLAINQWFANDLKTAYSTIRKYGYFHKDAVTHHAIKSQILVSLGNLEKAKIEAEKETNKFWKLVSLSHVTYALGNRQKADEMLQELISNYPSSPSFIAGLYGLRKDKDNAFKWLNVAYNNKDVNLLYVINYPAFSHLWGDDRWQELLDKIGLQSN